ncbi:hypothetical protein L227DRAFT_193349 [Lentinus tigrinus ALCF2SS1-6]|uniref:Uncharacterized protein n=2 Tax=Lentinus tigrinus TaxID=5365 RepID=A0A5C2S463_9APHY|nr:hypothetical protein L227DRAFT_193349 [Lentinus tigrinus ALCF2SS1-6]
MFASRRYWGSPAFDAIESLSVVPTCGAAMTLKRFTIWQRSAAVATDFCTTTSRHLSLQASTIPERTSLRPPIANSACHYRNTAHVVVGSETGRLLIG